MKEQKDSTEEAFDAGAFAQLLSRPGGRKAGAVFLSFGVPGKNRHGSKDLMDPSDETQAPIARIQTDDQGVTLPEILAQEECNVRNGW